MKEIGATFTKKQNLSSQQKKVTCIIRNKRLIVPCTFPKRTN